ncbi:MAG: response regulator transcription factor [Pseudomonadota bacterium]
MTDPIRIVIADDHPMVLDGVAASLDSFDHISVVGAAHNGEEALAAVAETKPDIAILDINMPVMNGLKATERLAARGGETRVLILSMHENREYIDQAMAQGARGYILKTASAEEIVDAIETVHRGDTYVCRHLTAALADQDAALDVLTPRESSILAMIAKGASNKEIGRALDISFRTVETHRKNIKRKLGVASTAGLAAFAIERGLV